MNLLIIKLRILLLIFYHNCYLLFSVKINFMQFIVSIRKQVLISTFFKNEKYVKAGGKYYINPFAPHFPSKYFLQMLTNNTNDKIPLKPNYAQISFTNLCPCECFHCHVENNNDKQYDLPLDLIQKTLDDIIKCGFLVLFFVGGEPISRFDDLEKAIKYISNRIDTRIFTSGVGITVERLKKLKQAGLNGICVSIDHYEEEIHNALRNNNTAFKSACFTIKEASKMGFYVSAVTCVTGEAARNGEFKKVVDLAESLGAHSIQLNEIRPVGRALQNNNRNLFLNETDKKILINYHKANNSSKRKIATVMPWFNEQPDKFGCMATSGQIVYINSNGGVQPCVLARAEVGNIKEQSFEYIWNNFLPYCKLPVRECIVHRINEKYASDELPIDKNQTFTMWEDFKSLETIDLFKKFELNGK